MRTGFLASTLVLMSAMALAQPAVTLRPYTFKADNGTKVQAEWGELVVPKQHAHPDEGNLTLSFVLFPSTNPHPGAPIVYLAGGPGGSGIDAAQGKRFPLFMALRKVADVIALDQRGTGASNSIPSCSANAPRFDEPLTHKVVVGYYRSVITHCVSFWRQHGVDLSAYNTRQNALDLESLRNALGVKKLNLWGISYGGTLALATLKVMPNHIDRVAIASPLGMNQTLRLPSRTQDFLQRVADLIKADPKLRKAYPDLLGTMKIVLDRVSKQPVKVTLKDTPDGKPVTLTIGKFAVQTFTVPLLKDPSRLRYLPAVYSAMAAGHFQPVAQALYRRARSTSLAGMGVAVRAASCVSPKRARLAEKQARTTLLGDSLNFFTKVVRHSGVPHLERDFCKPVHSAVPTLVLTGTLDGRTYPAGHAEILKGLSHGSEVVIENAGHDLFMSSPKVTTDIVDFFSGKPVSFRRIKLPPPDFVVASAAR
ncbi:MAG: alpha/beta hydrolase [Rhodanobacteraceae bacterium]